MIIILTFSSQEEQEKFELIYSKYKKLLLYKANQILHDMPLAEDAVSEALLRIYQNLHKIGDPLSNQSIAFIVTIVKNTALTIRRKETAKQPAEMIDDLHKDSFNLEEHILSEISSEKIYELLEEIGEELRSVFLLKFSQDLSHREIAGILQITENNVTVRLHRAKKKIAQILMKEGYVHGK